MTIDPKTIPKDGYACEACISGSQTRNLSNAPMTRRTVPGDRIHSDICGWITPTTFRDFRYILTFTDDATRMTYLLVLQSKTAKEVRECFLEFRNIFEQDGRRINPSTGADSASGFMLSSIALSENLSANRTITVHTAKEIVLLSSSLKCL